jgi:hypothetical protein
MLVSTYFKCNFAIRINTTECFIQQLGLRVSVNTRNSSIPNTINGQKFSEAILEGKCNVYIPLACRLRPESKCMSCEMLGISGVLPGERAERIEAGLQTNFLYYLTVMKKSYPSISHKIAASFIQDLHTLHLNTTRPLLTSTVSKGY